MELRDYLAVLAKRWVLIVSIIVVALGASAGAALLIPATYRAETQLFVSTQINNSNVNQDLLQGGTFSVDRVKSYTELATSPKVLNRTIAQLQLRLTAGELADKITTSVPLDTVLIQISATDESPQAAAAIANSVGISLAKVIEELENPNAANISPVKATVVSEAVAPRSPFWPDLTILLGVGLLCGLVVGIGIVVLLESLDTTIKDRDDLTRVTGLPVLASVVREGGTGPAAANAIVPTESRSERSEAYRQLRTNLQFAAVGEKPGVILVTSAVSIEGKSSVAGNLAMSFAQIGLRVCLVDGDLRRPSVAEYFGLVPEVGLTTVLIGSAEIDDALQPVSEGLVAITSGAIPPNPTELLGSERAVTVLKELSERFDMVVVDAPPVLPVADAAVLSTAADGVLFVVHSSRTTRHQVSSAIGNLTQVNARILGVVLNMVSPKGRSSYGDKYGYGYSDYQPRHSTSGSDAVSTADENTEKLRVLTNRTNAPGDEAASPAQDAQSASAAVPAHLITGTRPTPLAGPEKNGEAIVQPTGSTGGN